MVYWCCRATCFFESIRYAALAGRNPLFSMRVMPFYQQRRLPFAGDNAAAFFLLPRKSTYKRTSSGGRAFHAHNVLRLLAIDGGARTKSSLPSKWLQYAKGSTKLLTFRAIPPLSCETHARAEPKCKGLPAMAYLNFAARKVATTKRQMLSSQCWPVNTTSWNALLATADGEDAKLQSALPLNNW